jgi:hypothetical protein
MTVLRDLTADLDQRINDVLGDEITYTPAGGEADTFNTWVEVGSTDIVTGNSAAKAARASIEVPFTKVAEPSREDRVAIAIRPGRIYAPASWEEGQTGSAWIVQLKRVTE